MNAPLHPQIAAGGDPFKRPMASGVSAKGAATGTITYDELADLAFAKDVPCVPKEDARWLIPSTLTGADARSHSAQRDRGEFVALVLDIDEGGHSLAAVEAVLTAALGDGATALVYSTKSAAAGDRRWRVVVPLQTPLAGADYADTAEALCERIEEVSGGTVAPDRSMCRSGQIAFLPNRPDAPADGGAPFYVASEIGPDTPAALVLDADHPIIGWRERRREERAAAEAAAAFGRERRRGVREKNGTASLIDRFNRRHSLPELLHSYGYLNKDDGWGHGWTDDWRSPYQGSRSFATRVFTDAATGEEHWVSLSGSDKDKGVGAPCASGRHGDAFDLFVHYAHGGDMNAALAEWRGECDRERRREAASRLAKAQAIAAGGDGEAEPDPAAVERLAAMAAVETDDASLAAGWLADEGDGLLRLDDGSWRRFDGGHWQHLDDEQAKVRLSAWLCTVADLLLLEADVQLESGAINRKSHEKAEALRHHLRSTAQRTAVFGQARSGAPRARVDDFDAVPHLLGTPGGRVIDLRTGEEREGRPEHRVSLSTAVAPAPPGAVPTEFLRFIGQIADGREGWAVFLQRLAGYGLTGSTEAQSIFFLYGAGANGKSVLRKVLLDIAGEYGRTASADVFARSRGTQHPAGVAALAGGRAVMVSELPAGMVWNGQIIKDTTGGEPITARHMYGSPFTFTPQMTVVVTGNHRPSFAAADAAMERRMVLLEFRRIFSGSEIDPKLAERLLAEEGPAILRWAIDGAAAWYASGGGREGLAIPADVLAAGRRYAEEEDVLRQFLIDQQLAHPHVWAVGAFIATDALYRDFRRWAEDNGHRPWTKTTFGKQLAVGEQRYGISAKRTKTHRGFTVERLLIDAEERKAALERAATPAFAGLTVIAGGGQKAKT